MGRRELPRPRPDMLGGAVCSNKTKRNGGGSAPSSIFCVVQVCYSSLEGKERGKTGGENGRIGCSNREWREKEVGGGHKAKLYSLRFAGDGSAYLATFW